MEVSLNFCFKHKNLAQTMQTLQEENDQIFTVFCNLSSKLKQAERDASNASVSFFLAKIVSMHCVTKKLYGRSKS